MEYNLLSYSLFLGRGVEFGLNNTAITDQNLDSMISFYVSKVNYSDYPNMRLLQTWPQDSSTRWTFISCGVMKTVEAHTLLNCIQSDARTEISLCSVGGESNNMRGFKANADAVVQGTHTKRPANRFKRRRTCARKTSILVTLASPVDTIQFACRSDL